jgi:hypothetical protein
VRLRAAALLLLATASWSKPPAETKTYSVMRLAFRAIQEGRPTAVGSGTYVNLGFERNYPTGSLRVAPEKSPDGRNHLFSVVSFEKEGKITVTDVILNVSTIVKKGGGDWVDGWIFRATPDGRLMAAVHAVGPAGKTAQSAVPAADSKARKLFEKELEFLQANGDRFAGK